jgi:hypothetical protein
MTAASVRLPAAWDTLIAEGRKELGFDNDVTPAF